MYYQLGFLALVNSMHRGRKMRDLVGDPLELEHHNPANGDALQRTTGGLLVWRKADNWTAFTDGYRTWVNGPYGIQERLNSERFEWEKPPSYRPLGYADPVPEGAVQGPVLEAPVGIVLHGSRSGRRQSRFLEFHGTRAYARAGCGGQYLAWHITAGEDAISEHLAPDEWGYHAREYSERWVGIEFAQPTAEFDILDTQIRAAAWWVVNRLLERWPDMALSVANHSEIPPGIRDGKSDPFPEWDPRARQLCARFLAEVGRQRGTA